MATPKPKSNTSPAFQFYPKDFLTSPKVRRMSLTERGAYITLLSLCWLDGSLPDDVNALAYELHVPVKQFERMWRGAISECFVAKDGRLTNPRLTEERKKQQDFRRRQSDNGKAGGRPKKAKPLEAETHTKGLGISGITQTEAKKSSPISDLQSPISDLHTPVKKEPPTPLDTPFERFMAAYPDGGRKGGHLIEHDFIAQCDKAGGHEVLMAALANHIASEQWQGGKIPGMDRWLSEERWRQRLPPPKPVGVAMNPRTAGNLEAAQRFVNRGRS